MHLSARVKPKELSELLLNVALVRPIFISGQPGIGKSSLVEAFAEEIGLECVSLLGTQLAAEDLIGVPQVFETEDGPRSRFAPPSVIARKDPYVLFLDELNGSSPDVQKAFYSLILEKRIGEYHLPEGSVVIGAGNRTQDNAIVRTMSSALVNRMVLVELEPSAKDWLGWARENELHEWVVGFISQRPDHLSSAPPKVQQPFSTPRSWHMLSDVLNNAGPDGLSESMLNVVAAGCLTPSHASEFRAYVRTLRHEWDLDKLLKGEMSWPREPGQGDVLLFLAQSLRARLAKELPDVKTGLKGTTKDLVHRSKALITELADIQAEVAQVVVREDEAAELPGWYLAEVIRDVPKIAMARR
jgi:MoxR-like ATPase